jgi:hypothetical protein
MDGGNVGGSYAITFSTGVEKYLLKEGRIPMMKRWLFGLVMLSFLSMCTIACAGNSDVNASGSTGGGTNEVYTQGANFAQALFIPVQIWDAALDTTGVHSIPVR